MDEDDYYALLRLSPDADQAAVIAAYQGSGTDDYFELQGHVPRTCWHVCGATRSCLEVFVLMRRAYETLSDPAARREYDEGRRERIRGGPGGAPGEPPVGPIATALNLEGLARGRAVCPRFSLWDAGPGPGADADADDSCEELEELDELCDVDTPSSPPAGTPPERERRRTSSSSAATDEEPRCHVEGRSFPAEHDDSPGAGGRKGGTLAPERAAAEPGHAPAFQPSRHAANTVKAADSLLQALALKRNRMSSTPNFWERKEVRDSSKSDGALPRLGHRSSLPTFDPRCVAACSQPSDSDDDATSAEGSGHGGKWQGSDSSSTGRASSTEHGTSGSESPKWMPGGGAYDTPRYIAYSVASRVTNPAPWERAMPSSSSSSRSTSLSDLGKARAETSPPGTAPQSTPVLVPKERAPSQRTSFSSMSSSLSSKAIREGHQASERSLARCSGSTKKKKPGSSSSSSIVSGDRPKTSGDDGARHQRRRAKESREGDPLPFHGRPKPAASDVSVNSLTSLSSKGSRGSRGSELPPPTPGGQLYQSSSDSKLRPSTSTSFKLPDISRQDSAGCLTGYEDLQRPKSRGTAAADRLMNMMSRAEGSRPSTSGACFNLPLKDTFARRTAPRSGSPSSGAPSTPASDPSRGLFSPRQPGDLLSGTAVPLPSRDSSRTSLSRSSSKSSICT